MPGLAAVLIALGHALLRIAGSWRRCGPRSGQRQDADHLSSERFEQVILVHGVREVAELAYHDKLTRELPAHEFLGEMAMQQLRHHPKVTCEAYAHIGRVTDLVSSGKRFKDLGVPPLNPEHDRVMICGPAAPGQFVIKRACVEQ